MEGINFLASLQRLSPFPRCLKKHKSQLPADET